MDRESLVQALSHEAPKELAADLVNSFFEIRQDVLTRTLGRVSAGKFVETVVQVLQHRSTGTFESRPDVERFLARNVENLTQLDDGLRVCASRIARGAYAVRNRRNIAHKAAVDPNGYDLEYLFSSARWILAELLRQTKGLSMDEAGRLIEIMHAPNKRVVEEIDGCRLVHGDFNTREEIIVLLHSHYPSRVDTDDILQSLERRSTKSVENRLRELFVAKDIHGSKSEGYRLTTAGFDKAIVLIARALDA